MGSHVSETENGASSFDETYPEHAKLRRVKDQTQAIGEFLDWMAERQGASLMRFYDDGREVGGGYWARPSGSTSDWLAAWADVDPVKLEREKRTMLAVMRGEVPPKAPPPSIPEV